MLFISFFYNPSCCNWWVVWKYSEILSISFFPIKPHQPTSPLASNDHSCVNWIQLWLSHGDLLFHQSFHVYSLVFCMKEVFHLPIDQWSIDPAIDPSIDPSDPSIHPTIPPSSRYGLMDFHFTHRVIFHYLFWSSNSPDLASRVLSKWLLCLFSSFFEYLPTFWHTF